MPAWCDCERGRWERVRVLDRVAVDILAAALPINYFLGRCFFECDFHKRLIKIQAKWEGGVLTMN